MVLMGKECIFLNSRFLFKAFRAAVSSDRVWGRESGRAVEWEVLIKTVERAHYRLLRDPTPLLLARKQCCRYLPVMCACFLVFHSRIAVPYLSFGDRIYRTPSTTKDDFCQRSQTRATSPLEADSTRLASKTRIKSRLSRKFSFTFWLINP